MINEETKAMENKLTEEKTKRECERAALEAMIDGVLESDVPEDMKADMRILKAHNSTKSAVTSLAEKVTLDFTGRYSVETKKRVSAYLTKVSEELRDFTASLDADEEAN